MPYNLNMENIIIHIKTRDMLPSISGTILHVRYSEHANSKSVQSSPIWRYNKFPLNLNYNEKWVHEIGHWSNSGAYHTDDSRWLYQMKTLSALLAICAGNSLVTGEFPTQRPVKLSFDVFFDLRLNKWLSKQPWGWWFEMPSCPLWRQCNVFNHNSCFMDILFYCDSISSYHLLQNFAHTGNAAAMSHTNCH